MEFNADVNTAAVRETLLGFIPETNRSAEGAANIRNNIKEAGLDISKCHGLGYDRASVMSGIHSGVQALIKQ